jgi:hypothetical protein
LDNDQPNGKTLSYQQTFRQCQKCCQLQAHLAPTIPPVAAQLLS